MTSHKCDPMKAKKKKKISSLCNTALGKNNWPPMSHEHRFLMDSTERAQIENVGVEKIYGAHILAKGFV